MAIITLEQIKAQVAFTDDVGADDDALLTAKGNAAQAHIERLLGFRIEETFGGTDQEPVPADLVEAVGQLAAWWYLQREAAVLDSRAADVPFGVREIVTEYRGFTF